jgi:hypothetical protein
MVIPVRPLAGSKNIFRTLVVLVYFHKILKASKSSGKFCKETREGRKKDVFLIQINKI